jgi:hypothetical protein
MWLHTQVDVALSRAIAIQIDAVPLACWLNAWRGLALMPVGALYCEGWAVVRGLIVEHGWLELEYPTGIVVDPTLCLQSDWPGPGLAYFPGECYTLQIATGLAIVSKGVLPLVVRHGAAGLAYNPYRQAFDFAKLYASEFSV